MVIRLHVQKVRIIDEKNARNLKFTRKEKIFQRKYQPMHSVFYFGLLVAEWNKSWNLVFMVLCLDFQIYLIYGFLRNQYFSDLQFQ